MISIAPGVIIRLPGVTSKAVNERHTDSASALVMQPRSNRV